MMPEKLVNASGVERIDLRTHNIKLKVQDLSGITHREIITRYIHFPGTVTLEDVQTGCEGFAPEILSSPKTKK